MFYLKKRINNLKKIKNFGMKKLKLIKINLLYHKILYKLISKIINNNNSSNNNHKNKKKNDKTENN